MKLGHRVNLTADTENTLMTKRSDALAERIEQGALELEKFTDGLTEAQWQTRGPKDARKVGVVV